MQAAIRDREPGQAPAARAVAASAFRCDRPWQLREDFLRFLKDAPAFLRQLAHMIVGAAIGRRQLTTVAARFIIRIVRLTRVAGRVAIFARRGN